MLQEGSKAFCGSDPARDVKATIESLQLANRGHALNSYLIS
jgi:hypothetical protein